MYNLDRFLTAQQKDYDKALAEVKAGNKQSHWMWYIFPQLSGLGKSDTALYYAISHIAEAKYYLNHPVLGERLLEICAALLKLETTNANAIFGNPDDLKLRSSMTLFDAAVAEENIFAQVLAKFFNGKKDQLSLSLLTR